MEQQPSLSERCAVVTGSNKGIGLATVRLLAQQGVSIVLTARDSKLGLDAVESLRQEFGLTNVVFHQLDVRDPVSIANLAKFVETQFGKLDILVNNAGSSGIIVDVEMIHAMNIDLETVLTDEGMSSILPALRQTYDDAVACIDTNYYGTKRVTEALLPLLQLSSSGARIVIVSSDNGQLKTIPSEKIRQELADFEKLNEEKLEKLLQRFLEDLKDGKLEEVGWSPVLPAYSISKQVLSAYTRVLAKRFPNMYINCVHPGHVKTDMSFNAGSITPEEGAKGPVKVALLPDGSPSGQYFYETNIAEF